MSPILCAAIPAADIKRYLDPKNCVTYSITERNDGTFETKSTFSEMPDWNQTSCIKVRVHRERRRVVTSVTFSARREDRDEDSVRARRDYDQEERQHFLHENVSHTPRLSHSPSLTLPVSPTPFRALTWSKLII